MENNTLNKRDFLRIGIDGRVMQESKPSGIPLYAINTIREMIRLDQKNKYIIFYNSFNDIKKNIPTFEGNFESRIFRAPNKALEWAWKLVPYPKIDRILDVDVFFSPHFLNIPLSKRTKRTTTIHDLSFIRNKKYFSWIKNFWHWQMNPKKICQKSDKIIAVSQSTKNDIVNLYNIDPKKITVIHNGSEKVPTKTSQEKEALTLRRLKITPRKYILFLATLEPRKNVEGIIDAFFLLAKKEKNYKLVIAGKKGWLFNQIFIRTKKYDLENRIVFTDFLDEEEKDVLFKNAKSFVFPSFCEGFGLPILEAKNYNLPIVTSTISSIPEVAKNHTISVNPHIVSDISEGIMQTIKNNDLRTILTKKGSAEPGVSWRQVAQKTLEYLIS